MFVQYSEFDVKVSVNKGAGEKTDRQTQAQTSDFCAGVVASLRRPGTWGRFIQFLFSFFFVHLHLHGFGAILALRIASLKIDNKVW